jgi:hypothetical protein
VTHDAAVAATYAYRAAMDGVGAGARRALSPACSTARTSFWHDTVQLAVTHIPCSYGRRRGGEGAGEAWRWRSRSRPPSSVSGRCERTSPPGAWWSRVE